VLVMLYGVGWFSFLGCCKNESFLIEAAASEWQSSKGHLLEMNALMDLLHFLSSDAKRPSCMLKTYHNRSTFI